MTNILIIVAIVIIALIVFIASRSEDFRVSRTATFDAAPTTVFTQIDVTRNWEKWSPWAQMDPNAVYTYTGAASGVGAITSWEGTKSGAGSSTIVESRPNEYVKFRLDFTKPMKATNITEFTLVPQGNQTVVTWTMTGKNNFFSKAINLVMNCEKMVGDQFDQGLTNLKPIVEAPAQ